jgi:hypothetical protein
MKNEQVKQLFNLFLFKNKTHMQQMPNDMMRINKLKEKIKKWNSIELQQ